jgi:hypothetical protein
MKIVIPLGPGSKWQNNELRYALRSFEKHLSGVTGLLIIGDKPDWLNCESIPFKDQSLGRHKERNIFDKVSAACKLIRDPFLFANDDHFLLTDFDAGLFPNYYYGLLSDKKPAKGNTYGRTIKNTRLFLGDVRYFDIHCPIVIDPKQFQKINSAIYSKPYGYLMKTLYAYTSASMIPAIPMADLKYSGDSVPPLDNRLWFSLGEHVSDETKELLAKLYPIKSRWEM